MLSSARKIQGTTSLRYVHTVVMIRHGESIWNVENRFTGWCDVPLTEDGEGDARDAGALLRTRGLKFDVAFTSNLERAWRTCAIVLAQAGQSHIEVKKSWRLNERHYGMLQGHKKNCPQLTEAFGEEKLMEWRKSYDTPPPSLADIDAMCKIGKDALLTSTTFMDPKYVEKLPSIPYRTGSSIDDPGTGTDSKFYGGPVTSLDMPPAKDYPLTESLKQCELRAWGYWNRVIAPRVKNGERVLIVAHANTIRALVKSIDGIGDEHIKYLKIPNGIPLVYTLDENLKPILDLTDDIGFQAKYLVSGRNHKKMMEYERCVRKKLRSLFEYLDTDGDGKITPDCLYTGLQSLQTSKGMGGDDAICEFEIEELLRCIPSADESGGVNLKAFLDSEETLLPKLSKLRLLQ